MFYISHAAQCRYVHYFPSQYYVPHVDLTNEQVEYQELAKKFTAEEIIPKAAHHDVTGEVSGYRERE